MIDPANPFFVDLSYEMHQQLCYSIAFHLKKLEVKHLVAISRGGLTAAHTISRELNMNLEFMLFRGTNDYEFTFNLDKAEGIVVFIDDIIINGVTYKLTREICDKKGIPNLFCSVVVDSDFPESPNLLYGIKSPHWIKSPFQHYYNVDETQMFREML